jgi:hypothetical protein
LIDAPKGATITIVCTPVVAPDRRVCHLGCYFGTSELVPFPFVVDLIYSVVLAQSLPRANSKSRVLAGSAI